MPGKRVQFDEETLRAVDLLARDSMTSFQELADEAFRDLLKKHGRPFDLRDALRRSAPGEAGAGATDQRVRPGHARRQGARSARARNRKAGRRQAGGRPE